MNMHVVLLPGMDGTGRLFSRFQEASKNRFPTTVIALPNDQILRYDELVHGIQAKLPTDLPFVLVAESFSGPIAVTLAAQNLPRLKGIVLVATFAKSPVRLFSSGLRQLVSPLMFRGVPPALPVRMLLGGHFNRALKEELASILRSSSPEVLAHRLQEVLRVDVTPLLGSLPIPLLYIQAMQDNLVKRHCGAHIMSHCPEASMVEVAGPHLVLQSSASECVEIIHQWLKSSVDKPEPGLKPFKCQ